MKSYYPKYKPQKKFWSHYGFPVILSIIVLIPNILALSMASNIVGWWPHVVYAFCAIALFLFTSTFLKTRPFFALHTITILLGLIEIVHLVSYKATTSLLFVNTIIISEPGEAKELFSTLIPVIIIAAIYLSLYIWISVHFVENRYLFGKKTRLGILFMYPVVIAVGAIFWQSKGKEILNAKEPVNNESTNVNVVNTAENVFPANLVVQICRIIKLRKDINNEAHAVKNIPFGIKTTDKSPETIVLIIGETGRYGNFGINGYHRQTTPRLCRRSHLVSFDSVYAIANLTTVSVPYILSYATPETHQNFPTDKSIVEAYNEAGFETAWIANQSFGNKIIMRVSETCNDVHYLPEEDHSYENYDIKLLKDLAPFLADKSNPRKFIVLHSLGSHFKYTDRYPMPFSKFRPDLNDDNSLHKMMHDQGIESWSDFSSKLPNDPIISELRILLTNSYDNSILYTDFFLDSTLQMLANTHQPCAVVYVADHGENLFDDSRNLFLHGTYSGSVYEYHVPMMIWLSKEYIKKHPETMNILLKNKKNQMSSMTVFHTLLDLGGLHTNYLDSTMSVASSKLKSDSIIIGLDANMQPIEIPTANSGRFAIQPIK